MQHLLRFLKPYRKELILGPTFKLLEAIFELIVPVVMAKIIDNGIALGDAGYIWKMCGLIVLLGVCGLGFALTCQYFAARCAFGFGTDLREALYRHINALSHTELDSLGTSTLINRITTDATAAQTGVNMFIRLAVRAPFLIIGAIVMSLMIDVKLSLIFLIIAPIVGLLLYAVMTKTIPMYGRNQKQLDAIARRTGENLDGQRHIRAFSRQKQEKDEFARQCDDLEKSMIAVGRISSILNPLTFMIMNLGIVAVLWFGGVQIDGGALSQGDLTAFTNYMTQILLAMVVMANLIVILTKAQASAVRVHEVLSTPSSMENGTAVPDASSAEAIAFDHVDFSYKGAGDKSLEDISFTLKKGQTLGIIGSTGCGKSTLASLIPRFYDAGSGQVRVFGQDVKAYDYKALRRCIGIVPQKAVLFTGTIAENLRWADPGLDETGMREALEIAQAWDFVGKMQYGTQTHLVQGGRNLSGGQKQRLTIARAIAGKPDILILDDSMSALDYATDLALRTALRERCGDMTVIMISQRATSLQDADLILVLDDGQCVGQGTHEELLENCEEYREIYNSQMQ
ncbi:MAG: ABC transporter ATP-binding protein [Oscillospiraceae bacterium]|nr:ABC transporter ATP-binding protein [Oscillospiraceae bacterium]